MRFLSHISIVSLISIIVASSASESKALAGDSLIIACASKTIPLEEFNKRYTGGTVDIAALDTAPALMKANWTFIFKKPNQFSAKFDNRVHDVVIESGTTTYPANGNGTLGEETALFLNKTRIHNGVGYFQYQNFFLGQSLKSLLSSYTEDTVRSDDKMQQFEKKDFLNNLIVITDFSQSRVLYTLTIPLQDPNFQTSEDALRTKLKDAGLSDAEIDTKIELMEKDLQANKGLTSMLQRLKGKPRGVEFSAYTYSQ